MKDVFWYISVGVLIFVVFSVEVCIIFIVL